jgi:succinyl-diaminopimelate desuccinylase
VERRATRFEAGSKQAAHSILMLGGESGGGTNFNVVPGECWFTVDRRINPEEDFVAEKAALLAVLESCKDSGIPLEWEIFQEGAAAACDEDGVLGKTLAAVVHDSTGTAPKFEICPGLLENRFYAGLGIPALAYGPGVLAVSHGPNEYVDLRKIVATAGIYALTAVEVFRWPSQRLS